MNQVGVIQRNMHTQFASYIWNVAMTHLFLSLAEVVNGSIVTLMM